MPIALDGMKREQEKRNETCQALRTVGQWSTRAKCQPGQAHGESQAKSLLEQWQERSFQLLWLHDHITSIKHLTIQKANFREVPGRPLQNPLNVLKNIHNCQLSQLSWRTIKKQWSYGPVFLLQASFCPCHRRCDHMNCRSLTANTFVQLILRSIVDISWLMLIGTQLIHCRNCLNDLKCFWMFRINLDGLEWFP